MCGIAGYLRLAGPGHADQPLLETMLGLLTHRGPDECGIYVDDRAGLASARLCIVDLEGGTQPIGNETGTVWVVFNGEIYNHRELRAELEQEGHVFTTRSDTEVIVHLYEELGTNCVERLNGQFAFVVWDRSRPEPRMMLARDRVGIRPLFTTIVGDTFYFGSEIKALFADPRAPRRLDPRALAQVFTLWTTIGAQTPFAQIDQIPPGHIAVVAGDEVRVERYWDYDFAPEANERHPEEYAAELRELLTDATRLRLNADVAVGSYLSGGLDSSTIARLALSEVGPQLRTFSIAFARPDFDERTHQDRMVQAFETDHSVVECSDAAIAQDFPDVVWHTEWPVLRTAPAPMRMLSGLTSEHGIKVVLTGEGADEILGGYGIFKEDRVRRFWARRPESTIRPALLGKLYPYVDGLADRPDLLARFFGGHLTETSRLDYSHMTRWSNGAHLQRMFSKDMRNELGQYDPVTEIVDQIADHPRFAAWTPLARAQYIEMTTFMAGYLLSSQGDRMLMANSVEGRFPFLDHRLIELVGRMPDQMKLRGLNEKYVLKRAMQNLLPNGAIERPKQPFRAPIQSAFADSAAAYVPDLLGPNRIREAGIFEPRAMEVLMNRLAQPVAMGERNNMALAGTLSTMLLYEHFVAGDPRRAAAGVQLARRVTGPGVDA